MGRKKMIAVIGMKKMPLCCSDCQFREPGETFDLCLAQSYKGSNGEWQMHELGVLGSIRTTRRDPSCPLVAIECTAEAYWVQESDTVVMCSRCDSGFREALIHDVADYGEREYPIYCPSCGAYMVNWETGEDPGEEA